MAVTATPIVRTADELLRMPDDGMRHELVRGELRAMSLPGFEHGRIALRVGRLLDTHAEQAAAGGVAFGETGFVLARDPAP